MNASRTNQTLTLAFTILERRVLQHLLDEIILNYQTKPEDLDPKAASAWYSTRGCERAKLSADDTREWLENLHQYRSGNVEHLTKWRRRLAQGKSGVGQLKVKLEEAPILLTALNDHRLLLAARHDIGQKEMDTRSLSAMATLPPAQQVALSEIHFLAGIIEHILHFLPGNPGGWMEAL